MATSLAGLRPTLWHTAAWALYALALLLIPQDSFAAGIVLLAAGLCTPQARPAVRNWTGVPISEGVAAVGVAALLQCAVLCTHLPANPSGTEVLSPDTAMTLAADTASP